MRHMDCDVAIIGGGCAGLSAAATAAENGGRVVLLDKAGKVGGASNGGNGMFAAETRMQHLRHIVHTREQAFNYLMDFTNWRVDARLVKAHIDQSSETIEWLESLGVLFSEPVAYYPGAPMSWHCKDQQSTPITEVLAAKAKEKGAVFLLETTADEVIKEGERAAGVRASEKDGEKIEIKAGAVIIATGGFGDNVEWINKYTGLEWNKDIYSFRIPGLTGDGIRLAWDAGADSTDMYMETFVCLPDPYGGPLGTLPELGSFRQPNLMVNLHGERFMNEEIMKNVGLAGNAVRRQKGGCAFMIFDETINRYFEEHDWDFTLIAGPFPSRSKDIASIIRKAREEGYANLFMADSLEELAEQTGINPQGLHNTVDEYNKYCDSGRDKLLFKNTAYLRPVKKPPYYAARFFLGGYGSMGGIKINHRTEVIDKEQYSIPGLYAAGTDANAIFGGTFPFAQAGSMSGFAYNTGRIAGRNALSSAKSL